MVSWTIVASISKVFSVVLSAARDTMLVWLGRRSAQAKQAEAEAETRAKQAAAAADSPDGVDELIDGLRKGGPL